MIFNDDELKELSILLEKLSDGVDGKDMLGHLIQVEVIKLQQLISQRAAKVNEIDKS